MLMENNFPFQFLLHIKMIKMGVVNFINKIQKGSPKEIIKVTEHVTNKCGRGQLTYGMYLTRRDKTCGSKIVNDHHYCTIYL